MYCVSRPEFRVPELAHATALLLTSIFALVLQTSVVTGFNIDLFKPIVISDPSVRQQRPSFFGYSVALHNYSTGTDGTTWVLVGAPRGNRQSLNRYPPPFGDNNVTEPGVLYKCSLWSGQDSCSEVVLDISGNTPYYPPNSDKTKDANKELKDHGWVGVSLDAQPTKHGRVAVCGHRWIQKGWKAGNYFPNGVCYWTYWSQVDDTRSIRKLVLLRSLDHQYTPEDRNGSTSYLFALGQLGTASHFPKNNEELLMGAPGVNMWRGIAARVRDKQGRTVSFPDRLRQNQVQPGFAPFAIEDVQTERLQAVEDNSYWGYAVTSGVFGQNGKTSYVAGAPRANLHGEVHIFDYEQLWPGSRNDRRIIRVKKELKGTQLGEFYGGSVAALDINGDGLDDLAVGAPSFSFPTLGDRLLPDQGRVEVFLNQRGRGFAGGPIQQLIGSKSQMARFGQSLSAIGDINRDGLEDLAVGAPYEDNGAGAVYVYLGSNNGFRPEPQVIKASSFNHPSLRGFGISVSRGVDMDNNGYPDIAVGSYQSGHAVILRSRPVAYLNVSLVTNPRQLAPDDTKALRLTVEVTVEYASIEGPRLLEVEVTLTADARRSVPRGKFVTTAGGEPYSTHGEDRDAVITFPVTKGGRETRSLDFEISSKDFTKALVTQADIRLPDPGRRGVQGDPCKNDDQVKPTFLGSAPVAGSGKLEDFCKTYPILDPLSSTRAEFTTSFVNGCGDDDECISNLAIYASWVNETSGTLVIGSKKSGTVLVHVTNNEEPAFDTVVNVGLSERLSLARPPPTCSLDLSPSVPASDYGRRWLCGIGTVTKENPMDPLEFQVDFGQLTALMTEVQVNFAVKSSSLENYDEDNFYQARLPLAAEADITIMGGSFAEKNLYTKNQDRPEAERKSANVVRFEHRYQISKYKDTPIDEVDVTFLFPVAFASGAAARVGETTKERGNDSTTAVETFMKVSEKIEGTRTPRCTFGQISAAGTAAVQAFRDPGTTGWPEIPGIPPLPIPTGVGPFPGTDGDNDAESGDAAVGISLDPEPNANFRVVPATAGEHSGRRKRNANNQTTADQSHVTTLVDCSSGLFLCQEVRCVLGPFLDSGSTGFLVFEVAVDMSLMEPKLEPNKPWVQLVTESKVAFGSEELLRLHGKHLDSVNKRRDNAVVFTFLEPAYIPPPGEVPLWWYIVAIVGGLAILALFAFGLAKAGFFRRSKLEEIKNIREQDEALLKRARPAPDGQEMANAGAEEEAEEMCKE